MSAKSEFNDIIEEKDQREVAIRARLLLADASKQIVDANVAITTMKQEGNFDTLPTVLKESLNSWANLLKTVQAEMQKDVGIMELYQWSPE